MVVGSPKIWALGLIEKEMKRIGFLFLDHGSSGEPLFAMTPQQTPDHSSWLSKRFAIRSQKWPPLFLGVAAVFQSPISISLLSFWAQLPDYIAFTYRLRLRLPNLQITMVAVMSIENCTFIVYKTFEGNNYVEFDASVPHKIYCSRSHEYIYEVHFVK